jgi:hypothetical protein
MGVRRFVCSIGAAEGVKIAQRMSYCPASNENLLASYSRKLYHEARKRVKRDFLVIPTAARVLRLHFVPLTLRVCRSPRVLNLPFPTPSAGGMIFSVTGQSDDPLHAEPSARFLAEFLFV